MKQLWMFVLWFSPILLFSQSSPNVFLDAQVTEAGKLLQTVKDQSLFAVASDKAQADFVLAILSIDLRNESKNLPIYSWTLYDNSRRIVIASGEELSAPDCLPKAASAVRIGWQIRQQLGFAKPTVGRAVGISGSGPGSGIGIGSGTGVAPYVVGKGVTEPIVITNPRPGYTQEARDANIEGIVVLQVVIRKDGSVGSCKVIKGLGYGLDEVTVNTIMNQWKFKPGTLKGQPVDVLANIEVTFKRQ